MKITHLWLRWLAVFALAGVQALAPVPAEAQAQTSAPLPAGLYQALLEATGRDAASFRQTGSSFSLPGADFQMRLDGGRLALSAAGWNWSLQLDGFGRGSALSPIPGPAGVQAEKTRVTYRYAGISQWFRNSGIGLEQGFSIAQRPSGAGQLVLRMQLATGLKGRLSQDARTLSFDTGAGKTLLYSNLHVSDAAGRQLDARLVYTPRQIIIQADDAGALYPLTVDPLIYIENKRLAPDGAAGDQFSSVAISGDTAVIGAFSADVGANADQGAAYVFVRSGTNWVEQAKLTASDGAAGDWFGGTTAISGDTIVAGAELNDGWEGAAYVFVKPAGGWADMTQTAKLTPSIRTANDYFGVSVAISGNTAVVGANDANSLAGAAYVFVKPVGGWANMTQTATLSATDGAALDYLGTSVAISGDTVLVGADGYTTTTGKAYVFVKPGGGWADMTQTARLTASDGAANDRFGASVSISGDTAVIGAPFHDVAANVDQGLAYVFVKPGGGWVDDTQTARLTASDGAAHDNLGGPVAISGDTILAGAPLDDVGAHTNQGSAYLFVKPAGGWADINETTKLTASDGAANDSFGIVALDGSTALIGAFNANVGANTGQGAAYFYYPYRSDQDLAASAWASSTKPVPGQAVILSASVTNLGPASASNVLVSAPLPAGFSFVSAMPTSGTYDSSSGLWQPGDLAFGVTATLDIHATVTTAAAGSYPVFTANLLSWDTNNANNSASVSLHVPLVSFTPGAPVFADQLMLTAGPPHTITVTNLSGAEIELGSLAVPAGFALSGDGCSTVTLPASGTCSFNLALKPSSPVTYSGNVNLPSLVPSDLASLPVHGTGVAGTQLLTNRSFEAATLKVPNGWVKSGTWAAADGRDCSIHHSLSCSLKFTGTNLLKALSFTVNKAGVSGDDFLFSIWSSASSVPAAAPVYRVRVQVYLGAALVTTYTVNFAKGTHVFTKSSLGFTMTTSYTKLVVIVEYNAASGSAWFDDAGLVWAP